MRSNKIAVLQLPDEVIQSNIYLIRGQKVLLDRELAFLYEVSTKALNQAVKRNLERFPPDFMFELTAEEKNEVVTNCDHLRMLKFSHALPYTFTEHGAVMLANVLSSPVAVKASIQGVRAFIRLRGIIAEHKELVHRLDALEQKYDAQFKVVFKAVKRLLEPPPKPKKQIRFHP